MNCWGARVVFRVGSAREEWNVVTAGTVFTEAYHRMESCKERGKIEVDPVVLNC